MNLWIRNGIAFLFCFFFFCCETAKASHIYGADFYYTHIIGNTYRITLAVYGDCAGAAFPNLANSTPQVQVFNNTSLYTTLTLSLQGNGVEVTPVCPNQANNTTCKGGSIPGITRFIYSQVVTLNGLSSNWRFFFTGTMGGSSAAGRTNSISNIDIPAGGSLMVLEATLNNLQGPNSSPTFTTIPTPFYCVGVAQQYNQGAVDPNSDSLKFELAPALESSGSTVTYMPGFSATNPLATQPGTFSYNTLNGQMGFTPSILQQSLIVNKVTEYKNGIPIGTSSREMTFIVLNNCNNTPPTGTLDTSAAAPIIGGIADGNNMINVCEGTPQVSFHINAGDPDGDTLYTTISGLPAGATANVNNNGTPSPTIDVTWPTAGLAPGTYSFFATYSDKGCPLSAQQTIAYSIRIIRPNQLSHTVLFPTQCAHKAYIRFNFSEGIAPRRMVIQQGSNTIKDISTSSSSVDDSLAAGTYTITLSSPKLPCNSQFTLVVADSGTYPFTPAIVSPVFYCLNDAPAALIATPNTGATLTWYNAAGTVISGPPVPSTATAGIFTWYVSQQFNVCPSLKDSFKVYVTKRPVASISAPDELCTKDTASITFNGNIGVGPIIDYQWGWQFPNYLNGQGPGPWRVQWDTAGIKTLSLQVFENQCPSAPVTRQIRVKPTPKAIFSVEDICIYERAEVQYNTTPLAAATYTWDFGGGISDVGPNSFGPHHVQWTTPGEKTIFLTVDKEGCTDTASRTLNVYPAPDASILNKAGTVCFGDKIFLKSAGIGTAVWTPEERIYKEPDGSLFTRVMAPTTYHVIITNQYGCSDSDSIRFDQIEPCCNFSYPNAFTPNGDGRNDRYRVLTYGNTEKYEFSIYDRWGTRVFWSFNPADSWDGTYKGQLCEMGTYYYYLKAKCMIGRGEEQKGELILVR